MTPVRLEPAAPRSRVKHSTTALPDLDVNWMSPMQGKSHPVQDKEPYDDLDMVTCRLFSCYPEEYIPVDNACKGIRQFM